MGSIASLSRRRANLLSGLVCAHPAQPVIRVAGPRDDVELRRPRAAALSLPQQNPVLGDGGADQGHILAGFGLACKGSTSASPAVTTSRTSRSSTGARPTHVDTGSKPPGLGPERQPSMAEWRINLTTSEAMRSGIAGTPELYIRAARRSSGTDHAGCCFPCI
jgi:hypothetical protein